MLSFLFLFAVTAQKIEINEKAHMTGFVYDSTEKYDYVITAGHIMDTEPEKIVISGDEAKIIALDYDKKNAESDCALLRKNKGSESKRAIFRTSEPLEDEALTYFGFGHKDKCYINVTDDYVGDVFSFVPPPIPGDSGSPVLDDKGRVVGIVVSYVPGLEVRVGLAVRSSRIVKFIQEKRK